MEYAKTRNPHGRLTRARDVANVRGGAGGENTYWMTGNTIPRGWRARGRWDNLGHDTRNDKSHYPA